MECLRLSGFLQLDTLAGEMLKIDIAEIKLNPILQVDLLRLLCEVPRALPVPGRRQGKP